MTTETAQAPTLAELEKRVSQLTAQVGTDQRAADSAQSAFASAVKSGNVEQALVTADSRTSALATVAKTAGQLKTAQNAVNSAKLAANAGKVADLNDSARDGLGKLLAQYEALGIVRVSFERTDAGVIVNAVGPSAPKSPRAGGGGGGGRGQSCTWDGQAFASYGAALMHFFPEFEGKMGVAAITSKLANAGHIQS